MNCVKCGKPIPDGEIFCETCMSEPLRPSRKGGHQDVHVTAQTVGTPNDKTTQRQRSRLLLPLVIVSILACICAGLCVHLLRTSAQEKAGLRVRQAELETREAAAEQVEQELTQTNLQLNEAERQIQELNAQITALQDQIHGSESTYSQGQYDLETAQKQLAELTEKLTEQVAAAEQLEQDKTALEESLDELTEQYDALKTKSATMEDKLSWIDAYVVYVENDGSGYYHTYECPRFRKSNFWVYNRKLAETKGYTACPDCGG